MENIKEINIKNRTYYFFDDMINIENFNLVLLKKDKKSYNGIAFKNIDIYNTGYLTKKDSKYVNIHSLNPLYLIIGKADGSIEEKNGNKYLTFASIDKNKEVLKMYSELWNKTKTIIERINIKSGENEKDYMKI